MRCGLALVAFIAALASDNTVCALDGVVEINHVRALQGYITSSDTEGYPVTLDRTGSYRLTSNLEVGVHVQAQNRSGILITASNVTLDLNGFEIRSVTECTGTPPATAVTCTPTGSGIGIDTATGVTGITIYNGSVRGMGSRGIYLRGSGRVENVEARSNGFVGIAVDGAGAILLRNRARLNGNNGISVGAGAVLRDNLLVGNNARGATVGDGSLMLDNHFEGNRTNGVFINSGSVARGNLAKDNVSTGLAAGAGTIVHGNLSSGGAASGISVFSGSAVTANTIVDNTGTAIVFTNGNSGYGENVLTGNNGGVETQADGGGIQIGTNVCGSNTTCP